MIIRSHDHTEISDAKRAEPITQMGDVWKSGEVEKTCFTRAFVLLIMALARNVAFLISCTNRIFRCETRRVFYIVERIRETI